MSINSVSSREQQLETQMKDLLSQILVYFENFIDSQQDLKEIETDLRDYDDLQELCLIIKSIFKKLTTRIDARLKNQRFINVPQKKTNEYQKLEAIIQKHEAEIRQHISNEHQMRLYAESLQQQLEESEQTRADFVKQTTKMINAIKKENTVLTAKLQQQRKQNEQLNFKINDISANQKVYDDKLIQIPEMKESFKQNNKQLQKNQNTRDTKTGNQSLATIVKDSSDNNQSTEYPAFSQVSTKVGGFTNSGTTPFKLGRKSGERQTMPSNRNHVKDDYSFLQRKRGSSMHFKRDLSNAFEMVKNKSHSVAISKHNSQENSLTIDPKKNTNSNVLNKRRNSSTEASHRKYKNWQATLLKSQIK